MSNPKERIDFAKIAIVGIPLLLMLWGMVFILLVFVSHNRNISVYGGLAFFLLSIPLYAYLATKNASKLDAVMNDDEYKIRSGENKQEGKKKYLTKFDLWLAILFIVLFLSLIFVGQVVYGLSEETISLYLKIAIPLVILIELVGKKIFKKNK